MLPVLSVKPPKKTPIEKAKTTWLVIPKKLSGSFSKLM